MSAKNPDKKPRRRDPRGRYVEDTGAAGEHDSPDAISQAASSLWYLSHGQNAGRSKSSAANGSSGGNPLAQWGAGSLRDNSGFGAQPGDDGGDGPPDHSDESDDDDESGSDNDSESDDDAEEDSADMMLRFVAEETQACSKTDDVGILINNIDIQDISPSVVSMFNTEPRSMTVLLPALKKLVPVIQNLCKELSEAIKEGTEGSKLRSHLYRFLTEFTGAFRGHSFIASAALLMIISEHRNKSDDKAASRLFNLSYRAVKYVRHYCSLHTNKVGEFVTHASQGELTGSMECIAGSVGLLRLSSENKRLTKDTLIFIKGLIEYVCYEELDLSSAKDVCELLEIDIGDSDALLRMTDEETAEQWENRYRAAVEDAMRVCIQRNEPWRFPAQQKVLEYLQEGCTNPLWTQVMVLLDFEEVIWEQHNIDGIEGFPPPGFHARGRAGPRACMRRIRGPSLSATKFFLRDSKQPPVNSGRELQPVSERRHIRLVLDKCSDWYPIQFVQTNYSAPTEHISFVRIDKLSYRMVYNKHSCST